MKTVRHHSAFTLIELLVVIAIIAILAALALPALRHFNQGDVMVAATRQMLDDVERARQLAISQRTTVYMVFCPTNFYNDPAYATLVPEEKNKADALLNRQLEAYTFVTRRSVGNQPGQLSPRYLSPWRSLPDGIFIPYFKFAPRVTAPMPIYDPPLPSPIAAVRLQVRGFTTTNSIPFPSAETYNPNLINQTYISVPYIAFNSLGQLESGVDEYIPLARGKINQARDANGASTQGLPTIVEQPAGNSTNAFFVIHIDQLTGRARLEKQEVR